jgi:site-specific DNA recombinase
MMSDSEARELTPLERLAATIPDRQPAAAIQKKTLRFVFVGRVSTTLEDRMQDPEVSKRWQLDRAKLVVEGHGEIVEEVFDHLPRRIPWLRRPNAAELLQRIADGNSNIDALVVGESKRMFYSDQLGTVFSMLSRSGVQLWLPDIGRYDPENVSHRMLTMMEGIFGRVESETVSGRVKDAMNGIAESDDPRWLGGSAPFGFKLTALPDPERRYISAKGYTQTLAIDPSKAEHLKSIFAMFLAGKSLREIARALEEEGVQTPTGAATWHISTISTILSNQNYTGYRVYGKQHKVQVPFDPDDDRLGTVTARSRHREQAKHSKVQVYPELVSLDDFEAVNKLLAVKRSKGLAQQRAVTTKVITPLRGRVYCHDRTMESDVQKTGTIRFRLRGDRIAGLPMVAVSERALEATVDNWFKQTFSPKNIPKIVAKINERSPAEQNKIVAMEAQLLQSQRKLRNANQLWIEEPNDSVLEIIRNLKAETDHLASQIIVLKQRDFNKDAALLLFREVSRNMWSAVGSTMRPQKLKLYDRLNLRLDYFPEEQAVRISIAPTSASFAMGGGRKTSKSLGSPSLSHHDERGAKGGAPGGIRTPDLILRTDLLFH